MYKSWLWDDGFNLDNLKLEKIRYNFYGFEDLTFIVTESGKSLSDKDWKLAKPVYTGPNSTGFKRLFFEIFNFHSCAFLYQK